MSGKRRTACPKTGDEKEAGDTNSPDTSLPPPLSSIPQSPTCRKIFFDENFKVTPFPEASEEVIEQQKQKWNFDFQTETPLPGRYLWLRTEGSSGYYKNGKGAPLDNPPRRGEGQRRASKRSLGKGS
ncbi:cyclin-dependent kinase inhibitor 1 isoform X2 [Parasteatoda tepidariorum]|uniref:cyclin-dependent kinase inhibitor 1 isoform X2 n=1 Tax=Parasteatoda tepidariorum TaxID=114398 RepID=UPI00077F88D2|nr:cyclin-dependent kinase inhibitor 1 isoform X2 [Parasteatoda tepidariorum]